MEIGAQGLNSRERAQTFNLKKIELWNAVSTARLPFKERVKAMTLVLGVQAFIAQ